MSTFEPTTGNARAGARVMQITRAIATITVRDFKNFPSLPYSVDFLIALAIQANEFRYRLSRVELRSWQ